MALQQETLEITTPVKAEIHLPNGHPFHAARALIAWVPAPETQNHTLELDAILDIPEVRLISAEPVRE